MRPVRVSALFAERKTSVTIASVLFAAVFVLRIGFPEPNLGISFLFVAPVVLLSIAFGVRGAAWGIVTSIGLTFGTTLLTDIPLGPADYVVRVGVIAFVALTAAAFAEVHRRLEAETTIWFEQDIDLHCIASDDGRFLRVNEAFEQTLGYKKDELLSRPFIDFVHPEDRDRTIAETMMLADRLGQSVGFENRYMANDGTYHWLRWSGTPARDGKIYASARDVTEQVDLQHQLEALATTDPLTNLANRRSFEQDAERVFEHISRYGRSAAVLMLDLDGFKAVNDQAGHEAGDGVLIRVAQALRTRLRSSDLLARLGGDEFVMLLPEVTMAEAGRVAEQLLEAIAGCGWSRDGVDLPITGSIGLAMYDVAKREALAELVRRADQRMYEAKRSGGNRHRSGAAVSMPS